MAIEKYTKRLYDKFGGDYQKTRDEKKPERLYNDFLEVPCMIKAVGNIGGKRLLDVGCGAGVHIASYQKKGALSEGMDLSKTMISLAKKRCPTIKFKVGSISRLPYPNRSFDIVTASLIIDYVDDLKKAFSEVNRVLRKGGLFYYSDNSPIALAREDVENSDHRYRFAGYIHDKKSNKRVILGQHWDEGVREFEMVSGMKTKYYKRTFRTHLKALRDSGFELVDFIDCKPVKEFKRYDPLAYEMFTKIPLFSIYVCRKK